MRRKSMNKYLLLMLVIFITSLDSFAQIPCDTLDPLSEYKISLFETYPPLVSDMPYDVMLGYIIADSLRRNPEYYDEEEFFQRQQYADTLKYMMRYVYEMMDYDPIRFYHFMKYRIAAPWDPPEMMMGNIYDLLCSTLYKYDNSFAMTHIFQSYYILHIKVADTLRIPTIDNEYCGNVTEVSLEIIDTIKGRTFPMKYSPLYKGNTTASIIKNENDRNNIQSFHPQTNLVMWYCNGWPLGGIYSGKKLVDSNDVTYMQKGKEFIVFLIPRLLCYAQPSKDMYYLPAPLSYSSSCNGMYQIENGFVIDPGNDFGLGNQVPLDTFKNNIQSIINSIKNYGK